MLKIKKIFFIICFVLLIIPSYPAMASDILPKESFLIKSNNSSETERILESLGIFQFQKIDSLNVYEIKASSEEINILAKQNSTNFVEKNNKVKISQTTNDPALQLQDYLTNSNIVNAWDTNSGSSSIIVAVIDTGVDYNHEDLRNKMWTNSSGRFGYDYVNHDNDPMDDNGHGTQVSGIIAAESNNGVGIAGIANIKIMAIKAVPYTGEGDVNDLASGITYAANNGARIANVSLGLAEDSQVLDDAISYARTKNCLIVAATGNLYRSFIDNPARNPNAVGVGAIDESDNRAAYSNYGEGVSLVALGNRVYSTSWSDANTLNEYKYGNGTSFATPQVTGTAALIVSKDPSLTSDQVKKRLISSTKKISTMGGNYSVEYGYGKLDAYAALNFDKTPPQADVFLYKENNETYSIKGTVVDDKNSSISYANTPDSNIALVRYQIDGSGSWTILNNTPIASVSLDSPLPPMSMGNHNILLEINDTAGNKTNLNFSTLEAISAPASYNLSDYKYSFVSQSPYVNTSPGQTANISLALKNTGNTTWNKNMVRLGTSRPTDRNSTFANQTWASPNRIVMQEDSVSVGGTAHFNFSITAPGGVSGNFNEYFNLVADGIGWLNDMGIFWKISVDAPSFHAQFINQSPYITINRGEVASFWVEYKNTGSATWNQSVVKLGTSTPQDRSSSFYNSSSDSGWLSANRITMSSNSVAPGETARFNFTVTAPATTGSYQEYFRPVADGISWLEDYGLFWSIVVQ